VAPSRTASACAATKASKAVITPCSALPDQADPAEVADRLVRRRAAEDEIDGAAMSAPAISGHPTEGRGPRLGVSTLPCDARLLEARHPPCIGMQALFSSLKQRMQPLGHCKAEGQGTRDHSSPGVGPCNRSSSSLAGRPFHVAESRHQLHAGQRMIDLPRLARGLESFM